MNNKQVNVINKCYSKVNPAVLKSVPVWNQSSSKENKGNGTRVFKYSGSKYCSPEYTHNDNQWAVFICFKDEYIKEVVSILKSSNNSKNVFETNKRLSDLGGYYQLADLEMFGVNFIDRFDADYCRVCGGLQVSKMENTKIDNKEWTPTAEVAQRLAVSGSKVFPNGDIVNVDDYNTPNVSTTDPNPLFKQPPPKAGKWTNMIIHIHPFGLIPNPVNSTEECPNRTQQQFQYTINGVTERVNSDGPSPQDVTFQETAENKNPNRSYRSIIVDRYFIYLYNKNGDHITGDNILIIKRKKPTVTIKKKS